MSKYHITFNLEQHSPLIHFQHAQSEACLRASEVKPKLDAFIREHAASIFSDLPAEKQEKYRKVVNRAFVVDPDLRQIPASLYKMHFRGTPQTYYLLHSGKLKDYQIQQAQQRLGHGKELQGLQYMPYFADNDKIRKQQFDATKLGVRYEQVTGSIFSYDVNVLAVIKRCLPYFFASVNFGSRTSKGFGSFTLAALNGKSMSLNVDSFKEQLDKNNDWVFVQRVATVGRGRSSDQKVIQELNDIYRHLKFKPQRNGGDSSEIRDYFGEKDISWEKSYITEEVVKRPQRRLVDYSNDPHRKYVRALLGLAEIHDYQQLKVTVNITDVGGPNGAKAIERFPSPITFKIFQNHIFLCAREVPNALLGRTFEFTSSQDSNTRLRLSVPSEFSIKDFLEDEYTQKIFG